MLEDLRELWSYRELLATMVTRDLRIRYKNSVIGILWSFFNPLLMTMVTYVVFGLILQRGIPNFIAYYLASFLPFTFMQAAILDSAQSVLAAQSIVKKIYFPRELLPISSVIGNFIHLLLGMVVLFLVLLGVFARDHREFPIQATVVFLPFLLALTFLFTLGMALLVSALNTFYEDVKYIVSVLMYIMYFLCPIFYFIETVANSDVVAKFPILYKIYRVNPITEICILFRQVILAPPTVPDVRNLSAHKVYPTVPIEFDYIAVCVVITVGVFFLGYSTFNRLKWKFMERP